jgi:hypothetical protein
LSFAFRIDDEKYLAQNESAEIGLIIHKKSINFDEVPSER